MPSVGEEQSYAEAGYVLLAGENGSAPVKLTEYDAQRIQQHTGVPPDELENNDLEQSMRDLNIHSAPLSTGDYAELGVQPPQPQTVVVHRAPKVSLEEQLQSLRSLKEKGLITEQEYSAKKKQVLGL